VRARHALPERTTTDAADSLGYTEKAVTSARAARKKRWICAAIALVIIIVIVVVIVVEVKPGSKSS
jgi:syntaxin 1B/2/3